MQIPTAEELERALVAMKFTVVRLDNGMQITLNLDDANALWDGCQEYALWRPMCAAVYNLVAQSPDPQTSAVMHEHVVSLLLLMGMKMGFERAERDPLVKLFRREGP